VGADIITDMDEPPELQQNGHWRRAVWSLRIGFLGLAVGIVGVIVLTTGSTPWVLAAGVFVWLTAAVVTVSGVVSARRELPEPRPGLWPLRFMLLHDTFHARPSA
jgi:hypothetical protein